MGSKISVIVIVLALVGLAGVTFDSTYSAPSSEESKMATISEQVEALQESGKVPTFGEYLIDSGYYGVMADVDFNTNEYAKEYDTVISASVKDIGINFAGKYSIVTWGCGVDCQNSTIVDVSTGEIIEYGFITAYGLSYSKDSGLLIVNPVENLIDEKEEDEIVVVTDYYVMDTDNNSLLFVTKIQENSVAFSGCVNVIASAYNFLTTEVREFGNTCAVPFGWEILD